MASKRTSNSKSENVTEERRELNRHLWRMHSRYVGAGTTLDRIVEHEGLHSWGDNHEQGFSGDPKHRHEPGTEERMGPVIHEGDE